MYVFLWIILWRLFVGPIVAAIFGLPVEALVIPLDATIEGALFNLVTVVVGAYAIGRSGEKISENLGSQRPQE